MITDSDKKNYVVNKESREVIFLKIDGKPLGRYCELPGCNKRLVGQKVTRLNRKNGRMQTFELPIMPNQKFCSNSHRTKFYNIKYNVKDQRALSKASLDCRISLNVQHDKDGAYRLVSLYLMKGNKITQKIRSTNKELWEVLDKIAYYRNSNHKERIKPMNLLSLVNIKI